MPPTDDQRDAREVLMDPLTMYAACTRIQLEYIEMPDLKLTLAQVRRLCGLRQDVCETAVQSLVATGFLWQRPDGAILRRQPAA
jgi:hypothetical protein